jgi:hypothetical protein
VIAPGRLRHLLLALAVLALALGAAACGNKEEIRTHAETEGPYLDVGPLQYQVQISRQLNPTDEEDQSYFIGLSEEELRVTPDETWFGVWIKAFNRTDSTYPAANKFEIEDTVEKRYSPVEIPETNPFAYHPTPIPSGGQLPARDSVADEAAVGGSLLLFKLTLESLANRPLVLHIESPGGAPAAAEVDLDV